MLEALQSKAREVGYNLIDITEIRDGVSRTLRVQPANPCQNSYSVAKAFTATAVGILQDRGLLKVDDLLYPLFADRFPAGHDPKWERVTLAHLLTHRFGAGSGFLDIDVEDIYGYGTSDFLQFAFSKPLAYEPGGREVYTDAAFYLLSRVVSRVTGERLDDFLWRELFTPLRFQEVAWSRCPLGYPMGATGLYIYTRDMAKLGQLYLQNGVWDGRRIVSEAWVSEVLSRGFELRWNLPGKCYGKGGARGQMLLVFPQRNRVLAWHGYDESEAATEFWRAARDMGAE